MATEVPEEDPVNTCEPVDDRGAVGQLRLHEPIVVDPPKRKPGRPPGSLNKKTLAKQSAPPAKQAPDAGTQSKAVRPKKKRQPPSSDSGSSVAEEAVVVKRRKKRVVVMEESDSSPSPIVVKRKRSTQPSQPAAPEPIVTVEQMGKTLRDVQLERVIAQHQRYNGYFARLR